MPALQSLPEVPSFGAWTADSVKAVVFSMQLGKALGLDGWSIEELRLLPDFLHSC